MDKQTSVAEDGTVFHTFTFTETPRTYDAVEFVYPVGDDDHFLCRCGDDDGVEKTYRFELRDIDFAPLSVMGRGERSTTTGVSVTDGGQAETTNTIDLTQKADDSDRPDGGSWNPYGSIADEILLALNNQAFTLVPRGEWWLDV